MPRKNRKLLDKIVCHHMVQGINKEYIFETKEEKNKYLQLLKKYYQQFEIDIIAYCIMNNHVHMMLYSNKIQNISKFMRQVNSIYAMYYNQKKDRVGYVYRNRFKSVPIMTREQMHTCIKYIHMNPVKAEIVEKEEQYKYSSYQDYLNQTGFVNKEIIKFVFGSLENYIQTFKSIEYKELNTHNEKPNLEEILNHFLIHEKINLSEIRKNQVLIQKFMQHLNSNQYKFSKTEIAKILKTSRTTLYRRLYEK